MAMLAAPRRKQKVINLRAKHNDWSNDTNKFGQRMLEKMGWSSGKGLGAKENGMVEHIVARYKNDDAGLGYQDKNDQWTKHEDDFNALLANLSNGNVEEEKLHSGISLEDKSKKSKARVHYHKFTRGKDLTKYSEKDLANIFGKKSLKNEDKTVEESNREEVAKNQIFTDKGSMEDYFKAKLAALKTKNKSSILNHTTNNDNEVDYSFRGFSGTADETENKEESSEASFSFYGFQQSKSDKNAASPTSDNVEESGKKKKKKKEKHQSEQMDNDCVDNENIDGEIVDNIEPEQPKKKKKKSKAKKLIACVETESIQVPAEFDSNNLEIQPVKIKKSKKKKHSELVDEGSNVPQNVDLQENNENKGEDYVPKKKKKRKNKNSEE